MKRSIQNLAKSALKSSKVASHSRISPLLVADRSSPSHSTIQSRHFASSSSSTNPQKQHQISLKCPSCNTPIPAPPPLSPLCSSCSTLLPTPPPEQITYFDIFNLPQSQSLPIDVQELKQRYLKLQQSVHPDLWSGKGKETESREWSARVGEAWNTLRDEGKRGEYILNLNNVEVNEEDKVTDPELLMQVMEIREQIEDAQTRDEVEQIREENQATIAEALESLSKFLSSRPPDFEAAKNRIIQLRYLDNIEKVCREWEEK
ncbi:hypothetical protein T439DRAFT_322138 [Meredithblackwellia eburnea MCA 4105]